MKNKEFWKGAVAGALVVTCIGTGVFAGTGLAAKGTALGDRKCTSKLAYLEELIDRYYLGDKDEEKLQEGLYAGLLYGLDDPYSRYYTAEEYDSENSSNEGSYVGIGILMEKNKEGGVKIVECYEGGPGEKAGREEGTSSVPLTGKISQGMKYLMLQTLSAIQIKTVWCLLFTEKVQKMPWKSQSLSQMWNYRLFSMKCWILKSVTSALHSLQALPANSIRKLLMTCKNREWRK